MKHCRRVSSYWGFGGDVVSNYQAVQVVLKCSSQNIQQGYMIFNKHVKNTHQNYSIRLIVKIYIFNINSVIYYKYLHLI